MNDAINLYGDQLHATTGTHGTDIAKQRLDHLDIAAIKHILGQQGRKMMALDLGCGWGIQGLRFASLGVTTTLIDQLPPEQMVIGTGDLNKALPINYQQVDLNDLNALQLPPTLNLIFSQRFIHYLPFNQAVRLLQLLRGQVVDDARLYLSASGLDTELGNGYSDKPKCIEERFSAPAPVMAEKHGILEPVCLYQSGDLEQPALSAGYAPLSVWQSDFGNIKGIFKAA